MADKTEKDNISRRQFFARAGAIFGGAAIVTSASTACPGTGPTDPTNTANPTSTSFPTTKPSVTNPEPDEVINMSPPLMDVPDCPYGSTVATDRRYSAYQIWVLPLGNNEVRIGVSGVVLAGCALYGCGVLIHVGKTLSVKNETSFGFLETNKINSDLVTPISGTVLAINNKVKDNVLEHFYTLGWFVRVQLSDPTELDKLYTAQYHAYLNAPRWNGPIPPMH